MSSASSTARWIDCTVDSMLTTTPFFSPREGCEPTPSSSIEPSSPTSPTSDTTLEVPISRPTIRLRSARLSIATTLDTFAVRAVAAPADGEPVRVTHVHVGNVLTALRDQLQRGAHEFLEALIDLASPQAHGDAVGEIELPRAARIEAHRRQALPGLHEAPLGGEIALRDDRLLARRSFELRELRRDVPLVGGEQLAACVEETALAPARGRGLLDDQHIEAARPGALNAHRVDPRQRVDGAAHRREVHRQQSPAMHLRLHHALDVHRRHALEASRHRHRLDRLVEGPECRRPDQRHHGQGSEPDTQPAPVDRRQRDALPGRGLAAVFGSTQHAYVPAATSCRVKLVSSTRHTSSGKSTPTARAAMGTRLWLVMPGTVLTSSSSGRPAASIMKSARPQPDAPTASKAASARLARCASALAGRPEGQK